MTLSQLIYNPYTITAVVLLVALVYKLPTLIRAFRNPLLRQVCGLLLAACCVFIFAAPPTIVVVNDITGITNFSGPWVYSLLTGFCASCLLLVIKWRGGTPESIRRARFWVYGGYGTLCAALWILFSLGDHDVERLRDLDTYYATTPYMREMIVLYLLGHTVAVLITSVLLWRWRSHVRGTGWLHAGVVLLSFGYAANILYDVAKLTPVVARWFGRTDLDWMSTDLAPSIAAVVGVLIALGFILPHVGEGITHRWNTRREYWALGPLARTLDSVPASSAPVSLGRFAPLDLRLTQRQTIVRDALRHLAPLLDETLREQIREEYLRTGHTPEAAHAHATAAAITNAVDQLSSTSVENRKPPSRLPADGMDDVIAISRALRKPPRMQAARVPAAAKSESVAP
ncbi:MAB_1171c family putative transporter [Streptomyces sp. BV286]|uniref:MAB_1171c family putative transporter n=1 Tax=Streptomyces sp. BV286 TaxID=2849672 RepID=UPI0027E589F9|nr:MAB_1171c family putative transporter [Streptomyces sp. BV286]